MKFSLLDNYVTLHNLSFKVPFYIIKALTLLTIALTNARFSFSKIFSTNLGPFYGIPNLPHS